MTFIDEFVTDKNAEDLKDSKEIETYETVIFTDEDLDSMLNHHGVIHMKTEDGKNFKFMSERQYELLHPKNPKCQYDDSLCKNSDSCGTMDVCYCYCEWWRDFIQR